MKIVVLCGGNSTERDVSINSGYNVCEALRRKGHNAVLLDAFFGTENINIFDEAKSDYNIEKVRASLRQRTKILKEEEAKRKTFFGKNVIKICSDADIVFMALHGKNGEDGIPVPALLPVLWEWIRQYRNRYLCQKRFQQLKVSG